MAVVFWTANPQRLRTTSRAVGVIAKPYTLFGFEDALTYSRGA
jgi:hypothetical protein